ncbi:MAG: efflux RND transporter periplasmic adaptor subunit [Alphaproteobacteria bacterium]|nr:efflux RND transporter periplasmic adaptor subunit [Alphaproteobacteria bacterium]
MRSMKLLLLVALAAAALGAAALWATRPVAVRAAVATRGPAVQAVYATGTVEPVLWAKVGPLATGRLAAILVRDGAEVEAGQPLARLDDREARARLAELEAREKYWREELARQTQLAERGFASRDSRDRAQSEHLQLQASIAAQLQRIADLTLVSPMQGIVLRQDGEAGETVESKTTLVWVGQPRPLRITADVDEEDIPRVQPGQVALVKSDAFVGQVLRGTVAEITPKGDPVAKSYRVRIALPHDTPLKIGMTTEVNIVVREVADALLVPAGALRGAGDARHVFVVDGEHARRRTVAVGIEGRALAEILGGLDAEARVVVDPPARLVDGARVRSTPP